MTWAFRIRMKRYLDEVDRLLAEGDTVSASIILDVVAYAEKYARCTGSP